MSIPLKTFITTPKTPKGIIRCTAENGMDFQKPSTRSETAKAVPNMSEKPKNRVIEITPGSRTDVDSIILLDQGDTGGWRNVLAEVEMALDAQYEKLDEGDIEWKDIHVSIRCREMTDEELEELCE